MPLFRTLRTSTLIPRARGGLFLLALLSTFVVAGCGGSDGGTDPSGSFTLTLSSSVLTITQGANGSVTVTIARSGGFEGAVTITVSGLPSGVTAGALTIGAGSTQGELTLTGALAALVGNANLTVRGSGAGVADRTAPLALTVTAQGGGGGGNVAFDFCGATGLPLWVAYQDGNGAWTRADGAGPSYAFTINSNTGGIAWVTEDGTGGFNLILFFGTRAELIQFAGDQCLSPGAGKTVTGTIVNTPLGANFPAGNAFSLGGARTAAGVAGDGPITFNNVPNGMVDLIGGASTLDFGNFTFLPVRMYIQRNLNPPAGTSVGNIDLNGANSFAPAQPNLTINGVAGNETVLQTTMLFTANGSGQVATATGQNSWYGVPGARLEAGELQLLTVLSTQLAALAPQRSVQRVLAGAADLTLTLGPNLNDPAAVGIAANGYSRARTTLPIQPEYNRYWIAQFQQSAGAGHTSRVSQIQMTSGYRGSVVGDAVLEVPNFDGVTGWQSTWGLRPGTVLTWNKTGIGWTAPGGINQPVLAAGATWSSATKFGQFTP